MSEQERKVMMNLTDTMYGHVKKNIDKLSKMIYDARFNRGEQDEY